jgi:hypothetical protein
MKIIEDMIASISIVRKKKRETEREMDGEIQRKKIVFSIFHQQKIIYIVFNIYLSHLISHLSHIISLGLGREKRRVGAFYEWKELLRGGQRSLISSDKIPQQR